ncbi:hypothetical protein IEO21_06859 [Rhodonia placenta]|uniref:Fcf2 pre-rRNA processing C-terminal domain-containing protein n=1 Tax=Rhodonia placenta TaxID=104341 RepID=A0A8H7NZ89_9APHY|nr:hypothetical protein IEO21_06859 [Postia placenta]
MAASLKGKEKAVAAHEDTEESPVTQTLTSSEDELDELNSDTSSSNDSDSTSESDSDSSESDSEQEITEEFLNNLLEKARQNVRARKQDESGSSLQETQEEDEIRLEDDRKKDGLPLPSLHPGSLPSPYIVLSDSKTAGPLTIRDDDVEQAEKASSSRILPAEPAPPPELSAKGKPLTKKEKKEIKNKTAGPGWFDLPAPAEADLPHLYREAEALRLRNQLDPKRFYRKEEGEGKGIKGLPKHFAIGTIVTTNSPFGAASADNLSKTARKRTLIDELVDDAEAKSYAKKKFKELQTVRGAKGRGTLAQKKAMRKPKW